MPDDPNAPSIWLIMGMGILVMSAFILLLWLNHKWVTRGQPKSEAPAETRAPQIRRRSPVISRPLHQEPRLIDLLIEKLLRTERTNASSSVHERSPQQDARSGVQMGSFVQGVQGEILPNSREELQSLIVAIRHKDNGKTKQEAIERAFNVKKGGSEKWRRASELFDAATEPRGRYREYTPEMMAVLQPKPNAQDN